MSVWDPRIEYTPGLMNKRICTAIVSRGWRQTIKIIQQSGKAFDGLCVAEVGSGTGTFSLSLALLGAKVTLFDFNTRILEEARKIYDFYGCHAECVEADVLDEPPSALRERFDMVVSCGLAEHFEGKDRRKCIAYHKTLLKKGGFAYISVPHRISPFYWLVRITRHLLRVWFVPLEVPFSKRELKGLARKVGFQQMQVIGFASLKRDLTVYSQGFVSAILEALPQSFFKSLRRWRKDTKQETEKEVYVQSPQQIKEYCRNAAEHIHFQGNRIRKDTIDSIWSSALILFAFK